MILLQNLKFSYPNSDFHLSIDELEINAKSKTAVIGPSGFGKTTLLNLLAGIINPDEGTVSIDNEKVSSYNDNQKRDFRISNIGFVFQDFKLIEYLNVYDNILLPYRIKKKLKISDDIKDRIIELTENLKIGDKIKKYPAKLSQGEKQRVAICRALLNKPKILLADEPTGNLDPANKNHIMEILFDAVDKFDSTLVTVTHDHDLLKGFDKIIDFQNLQSAESK